MVLRNIVIIDEDLCTGCGDCVDACAEGAIEIIDGKAKLVSEIYCDGLGACLGTCPVDAITVEPRESEQFDEKATEVYLAAKKGGGPQPGECQCPGTMTKMFERVAPSGEAQTGAPSQLAQWPVQLNLVSPQAPYFKNADLLLVADCVPFAMADFHGRLLSGKALVIGCPKLDDAQFYIEKLGEIIKSGPLKSLTVVHMEVPCCFGMSNIAREAIARVGAGISFEDITVDLQGNVIKTETMSM